MGQELWLSEQQLPQLQQLGSQFVASLGMEDAISDRISIPVETLQWSQLSNDLKANFTYRIQELVNGLPSTVLSIPCLSQCICDSFVCQEELQQEYDLLVSCLKLADASLPCFKPGREKDWWTTELTALRQQSIDIQNLWISEGRP